ncbi:hypothetical protein H4S06_002013, partial [Coemansia sp. BCRC 34490]
LPSRPTASRCCRARSTRRCESGTWAATALPAVRPTWLHAAPRLSATRTLCCRLRTRPTAPGSCLAARTAECSSGTRAPRRRSACCRATRTLLSLLRCRPRSPSLLPAPATAVRASGRTTRCRPS